MLIQHAPNSGFTRQLPGGGSVSHFAGGGGSGDNGLSALYGQPGQFANAIGNTMNGVGQGFSGVGQGIGQVGAGIAQGTGLHSGALANLGQAVAGNYGAYATGNAAIANALANERAAAYGAMSQGEAARQLAAGNIANQALAAYGGMGNAAMNAWGQNQSSYNQALQNMFTGNQMAVSQLGQSRNQALANLGGSMSQLGRGLAGAAVVGGMDPGMGGFRATGPDGNIASGSYGGGYGVGMGGFNQMADRSFGAMDDIRGDINNNTFLNNLEAARGEGFDRLDSQHYSSRNMPFDALRDSAGALQQLAAPGYGALRQGMDQMYGNLNANRADFSPFTESLRYGFDTSSRDLRDVGGRMSDDFRSGMAGAGRSISALEGLGTTLQNTATTTQNNVMDLWKNTLGNMPAFQSPQQRLQAQREARQYQERSRMEDRLGRVGQLLASRPDDQTLLATQGRLQAQLRA